MEATGGGRGATKEEIGGAFLMHELRGMAYLGRSRTSQTNAIATSLKSHFIRHLEENKPALASEIEKKLIEQHKSR